MVALTHSQVSGLIRGDMIKPGAIVLVRAPLHASTAFHSCSANMKDVGINFVKDESRSSGFRLVGDVNFDECALKASYITPVPGGVGPVTVAILL